MGIDYRLQGSSNCTVDTVVMALLCPSKTPILWTRITNEEDKHALHALMVTQQYAKGFFRVLQW